MRTITLLIIHCSATPEGKDFTVEDIDRWHRQRGWKCIGYHYVIYLDGSIHPGRPESMVGAHCQNHNQHSIGVCYIGGLSPSQPPQSGGEPILVPADTRTPAQKASLLYLLKQLKQKYPNAVIASHHTFNPQKTCPNFSAEKEYANLQP